MVMRVMYILLSSSEFGQCQLVMKNQSRDGSQLEMARYFK